MKNKRDDMSHWGYDILGLVIAAYFLIRSFIDVNFFLDSNYVHYKARGFDALVWSMYFFLGGKNGVYVFFILMVSSFLSEAIIKINKIRRIQLGGLWRVMWVIARLAFLSAVVLFLFKNDSIGTLQHKHNIIFGLFLLPFIAWIIFAKVRFSLWQFFATMVYVVTVYAICLIRSGV